MSNKRYCVVGAGMAGLCSAKHALEAGGDVTVYEQSNVLGGTWVFSDEIGTDKYGLDVHTSMYKGLRTNLPKEVMGFPGFEIPKQEKSYIPAEDVLEFLKLYSDEFKVTDKIKFEHHVIRIRPTRDGKQWEVIVQDLPTQKLSTELFDFILVCNGHYHTPRIPKYPGAEIFKGRQMHSHDYKSNDAFENENVLIIGAGSSGMDLTYIISKKAKRVTLSHHMKENRKPKFPENVFEKPDVVKFTESGAEFTDGTQMDFSVVLYCTGYEYTFPFLSVDCGIFVEDNHVQPLYQHCINITHPSMAIIGLPFAVCAAQVFDVQARFVMKFFSGGKALPSKQEMQKDLEQQMKAKWEKGFKKRQAHLLGADQGLYFEQLTNLAEISPVKPAIDKIHKESGQRMFFDFEHFRNDIYKVIDDENFIVE